MLNDKDARRIAIEEKAAPTTVGEKYPDKLDQLLKLNNVTAEEDLPPIYHTMANRKRDGESLLVSLQGKVRIEATALDIIPMRIGVHHETALKHFEFAGDENSSNINTGLLPMTITPPGATSCQAMARQEEDREVYMDYNTVYEGNGNGLTLAESRQLRSSKAFVPSNWDEGFDQLFSALSLFRALHGRDHPVSVKFHKSLRLLVKNKPTLKKGMTILFGCQLGIAKLVHYYHASLQRWYIEQCDPSTTDIVPPPEFTDDINKWVRKNIITSWIPETASVTAFQGLHRSWDERHHQPPARQPLTPSHPNPPRPDRESPGVRQNVNNRNRDSRIVGESVLAKKIRACTFTNVIKEMNDKGHPVPKNADGLDHCLS